jgi:hypothetical protein
LDTFFIAFNTPQDLPSLLSAPLGIARPQLHLALGLIIGAAFIAYALASKAFWTAENVFAGIAVGLASKILPHNFLELIDASIAHLKGESFELFPDFPTGGLIDVSRYNDGLRGGSVRVRARISKLDKKTLNKMDAHDLEELRLNKLRIMQDQKLDYASLTTNILKKARF